MVVMVIPIVIGTLATVTKALVPRLENMEIKGLVETIQNKALLISVLILKKVQDTLEETCCHSDSSGKLSVNAGMKNSQKNFRNNKTH